VKLSVRGEYALRALLVLGLRCDGELLQIQTIADEQRIPKRFLEQILADLKSGGLLEARRGPSGGYRLRRPPEDISLAQIIRLVDGALAPIGCVSEHFYTKCSCPDEMRCALRSVMRDVRDSTARILEGFTLADLCRRHSEIEANHVPPADYVI
jgi:Rrf2 family protein